MLDAGYVREKLGKVIGMLDWEGGVTRENIAAAAYELHALVNGARPWGLGTEFDWIKEGVRRFSEIPTNVVGSVGGPLTIGSLATALPDEKVRTTAAEILSFAKTAKAALD